MKAITFNLLAWVMLPIMDGFAKYLSTDLPVLQITWARYFFTVVFTCLLYTSDAADEEDSVKSAEKKYLAQAI